MIDLPAGDVVALPVDQLAFEILRDLEATNEWHEGNYLLAARAYPDEAARAISEAMAWLRGHALIARTPGQSSEGAIFLTRGGRRLLAEGPAQLFATEQLQAGVHPKIDVEARPQFLIGKYEHAVFASMKAIEVRIRKLSETQSQAGGVDLVNVCFGPHGPLSDAKASKAEREGVRALFAGAFSVLRNPVAHSEVNYDDVGEAVEAVHTASLLMRLLDRVEARLVRAS